MREEVIQYFTETEEEFANLLIDIGFKKNVAKVLVFLVNTQEATSWALERGIGLRQPEVSLAVKYMAEQGWVTSWTTPSVKKGRPNKVFALAMPVKDIMAAIEKDAKTEVNKQLTLVRKIRNHI